FLFAILVYVGLFASYGVPRTPPVVAAVSEASAAAEAGIRAGDTITRIDGARISRFEDIAAYVRLRPDQAMELEVLRAGRPLTLRATPKSTTYRDNFGNEARMGQLGVAPPGRPVIVQLPIHQVVGAAFEETGDNVKTMVVALSQLVRGQRSLQEMGGPLKIAQFSGQQATLGWLDFVLFMALISINLGFINLLPIPLLDGGHLLFYLIEGVRRKPLKPQAQEWAFRTGLAVLLALMIFVTFNDLASFGLFSKLGGLIG
ncbi:MAG TPA: RIP metalloprotease RseP, partial [Allosphingosinicella sp.]|nr:RIP metalloprotease RseP [Allosphingosinicella sp.]